jgi:hypothetical protein
MDDAAIDRLEAELAEICGQLNVLHAQLVDKVAAALTEGAWAQWGIHTPAQWLAWQTGLSPGRARDVVRIARAREDFPVVSAAFAAGELAVDQVAVATKAPGWTDTEMCRLAKAATVAQLAKVVRGYRFDDPPHPRDDPQPVAGGESVSSWFDDSGRWHLAAELDEDRGRLVDAALAEARDRLFHDTPPGERARVTGADALVDVPPGRWTRPRTSGGNGTGSTSTSTPPPTGPAENRSPGPTGGPCPTGWSSCSPAPGASPRSSPTTASR